MTNKFVALRMTRTIDANHTYMASRIVLIKKSTISGYGSVYLIDGITKIYHDVHLASYVRELTALENNMFTKNSNFLIKYKNKTQGFETETARTKYVQDILQKNPTIEVALYKLEGTAKAKTIPIEFNYAVKPIVKAPCVGKTKA